MKCGKIFNRRPLLGVILFSILFAMIFVSPVSARSQGHTKRSSRVVYRSLSVDAFARVVERDDVVLVDVRTPEEYSAGHLRGVDYNLNVRSATFFKDYQSLPKDKLIAVYCKGGGRSKQVAGVLAGNGYKVVELSVGYDGWVKAGGEVGK